jgi:filamentous hemagglutinin
VVTGGDIELDIGGNFTVKSVQDRAHGSSSSVNGSVTIGVIGPSSASAGGGKSSSDVAWVRQQTGFYSRDEFDVRVEKHTQLDGSVLNSDKGKLTLDTGTLGFSDILDHDKGSAISGQVGVTFGAPGQLPGVTVSGSYASHDIEQETKATVGKGTIVIRDKDKQKQDVADINRDPEKSQVVTKVERAGVELYGSSDAIGEIASGFEGVKKSLRDIPNLPTNLERGISQIVSDGALINKTLGQAADAIIGALAGKGQLSPDEAATQKEIQKKLKDPAYLKVLEGCAAGTVRCEYSASEAATAAGIYMGARLGAALLAVAPAAALALALNALVGSSSGGILEKTVTLTNGTVLSVAGGGSSGTIKISAEAPDGMGATTLVLRAGAGGYILEGGQVAAGGEAWEMTHRELQAVLDAAAPTLAQAGIVVVASQSGGDSKGGGKPVVGGGHSTPVMPDPDDDDGPKYVPIKKHETGGWGTKMDLDNRTAQNVLNNSVQVGKQRYGYFNGRLYTFQPDNAGGWHGYPIAGSKVPTSYLRILKDTGQITPSQYLKFIKGG